VKPRSRELDIFDPRETSGRQTPEVARGRPRSASADRLILDATLTLLQRHGYLRLSIDQIAQEAGVGRATIYRRYRSKADLVASAVASRAGFLDQPDTGTTRGDLLWLLQQAQEKYDSAAGLPMAGVLLIDGPHNPELLHAFRQRVLGPRRVRFESVLRRGVERGDLRPDLDVSAAMDVLTGSYYARWLSGRGGLDRWPEETLDLLWPALVAPDRD